MYTIPRTCPRADELKQQNHQGMPQTNEILALVTAREHHQYSGLIWDDPGPESQPSIWEGRISGKFLSENSSADQMPVVGDWVLLDKREDTHIIQRVFPRKTALQRKSSGVEARAQVIASNLEEIWLISALDGGRNFLEAFIERSLVSAWNSGATPVIVLNKSDLMDEDELEEIRLRVEELAFGVPIHFVSALEGLGIAELIDRLEPGKTIGVLGKTGVGKSALINALHQGEPVARTGEQRKGDLQGRHTTTSSRFYALENGAWIMDVPGLRELGLWLDDGGLSMSFPDIQALAEDCRFDDCQHDREPGCAVQQALASGELEQRRFQSWQKLQKELAYIERKAQAPSGQNSKAKYKKISKLIRGFKKPGRD